MHQQETAFENIVGKGEIAHNEQFLLFPQCFLLNQIIVSPFGHSFATTSLFAAELEEPKIGISGKGLRFSEPFLYPCKTNIISVPKSACLSCVSIGVLNASNIVFRTSTVLLQLY